MLKIAEPVPAAFCMPWHARFFDVVMGIPGEPFHGARCCWCDREVAAPDSAKGKIVACVYCGLDRGLIPEREVEP